MENSKAKKSVEEIAREIVDTLYLSWQEGLWDGPEANALILQALLAERQVAKELALNLQRSQEKKNKIIKELGRQIDERVREERETCAKVVESGYLTGTDCKNEEFACVKCGGDIRGQCCVWEFTHRGNVFIAAAIRQRGKGKDERD